MQIAIVTGPHRASDWHRDRARQSWRPLPHRGALSSQWITAGATARDGREHPRSRASGPMRSTLCSGPTAGSASGSSNRGEETSLELVEAGRAYGFDADGALLRLASEAYRIRLAHLFDPYLAVSTSQIADRGAAAQDHRRLRRDAAAPADSLSAGRRCRRRRDDHGRASHQAAAEALAEALGGADRAPRSICAISNGG